MENLEKRIAEYFEWCAGEEAVDEETGRPVLDKQGQPLIVGRHPPTVSGLADHLGLSSRGQLMAMAGDGGCVDRALLRIERFNEEMLYSKECASGAKFNLQSHFPGWDGEAAAPARDEAMARIWEIMREAEA